MVVGTLPVQDATTGWLSCKMWSVWAGAGHSDIKAQKNTSSHGDEAGVPYPLYCCLDLFVSSHFLSIITDYRPAPAELLALLISQEVGPGTYGCVSALSNLICWAS